MDDTRSLEPSLPAALPHLDLRGHAEGPRPLQSVVLRTSALEAGMRTHICPQCGVNPTTGLVKRTFQFVPPWVYVGLLLNVLVLMLLYFVGRRVVKAELSLCADCDAADRRGRTTQSLSVVGLIGFPLALGFGLGATVGVDAGLFGAAAGVVSGIVGMVAAHRATRADVIRCVAVDKTLGTTTLKASDTFARVLLAEGSTALAGDTPPVARLVTVQPGGDDGR